MNRSETILTRKDAIPVVLLGADCRTGLQSARTLNDIRCTIYAVAGTVKSPYCRSRFVGERIGQKEFEGSPCRILRGIADQHGGRVPVLVPCTDESVQWMVRSRNLIEGASRFVLAESSVINTLASKADFYR